MMETEDKGHLPFSDINVYRRPDGTLGHRIYRKPTHTNRYLRPMSHHHPSKKHPVLPTLFFRAKAICDKDNLAQELEFLKTTFRENSYTFKQIQWAFHKKEKISQDYNKPNSTAILPYVQSMSGQLNRMFKRHDIRSTGLPG
jgi:hypothetical protein